MRGQLAAVMLFAFLLAAGRAFAQSCPAPDVTVTIPAPGFDGYVCTGTQVVVKVPDAGPGATYHWDLDSMWADIAAGQGTPQLTIDTSRSRNNVSTDIYGARVTVTNSCGASATSAWKTFTVISFDIYTVAMTGQTLGTGIGPVGCADTTYQLTVVPGVKGYDVPIPPPERTYVWQIGNATILSGQGTPSVTFKPNAAGSIGWSVIRQDRCGSTLGYIPRTGSFYVKLPISAAPVIDAPASVAPNSHNSVFLINWQSVFERVFTFRWSVGGNGTLPDDGTGMPLSFDAGPAGSVTITATMTDYCGHSWAPTATIAIGSAPPTIVASPQVCRNVEARAGVAPVDGATYSWSIQGGTLLQGNGTSGIAFLPTADQVTLSLTLNGVSATKTIQVVPQPDATITAPNEVASNGTAVASLPDAGVNARYTWGVSNGKIVGTANERMVTFVAPADGVVELHAWVILPDGCVAQQSAYVPVSCPPQPIANDLDVSYTGLASFCSDTNNRPCSLGELIRLTVASQARPLDACDHETWRSETSAADGPMFVTAFDTPGSHLVTVHVENATGSADASTRVTVGSRPRPARH